MPTRMPARLQIAVQNPARSRRLPPAGRIVRWVRHALGAVAGRTAVRQAEITVRFVSRPEAIALNQDFRGRGYAPNVLSFPYDAHALPGAARRPAGAPLAGDIAICPAVVAAEARAQGKPFEAHLAHLVVHGVLHLRGYDHVEDRDAARMERLESQLVAALGHGDPWASERAPRATMIAVPAPASRAVRCTAAGALRRAPRAAPSRSTHERRQ